MTGVKISTLPAADAANDTDQLEVNQGGTSRRVTVGQLVAVVPSEASAFVDVRSHGVVLDGVTDTTAAVTSAVAAAQAAGKRLFWPVGTALTTASIPLLHSVRHFGPGTITRGSNTFTVEPVPGLGAGTTNHLHVAPTGNTTNDGLSPSQPMTSQTAVNALANYGDTLEGTWQIDFAAGENAACAVSRIRSRNPVRFVGVPTGDFRSVPTSMITRAASGSSRDGLVISTRMQAFVKDLLIRDFVDAGSGLYGSLYSVLTIENVHVTNCYYGWSFNDYTFYSAKGGQISNCLQYGVSELFHVLRNFHPAESATNRTIIAGCPTGVHAKELCTGHMDFVEISDCTQGIMLTRASTANMADMNFKRNAIAVVLSSRAMVINNSDITWNAGTADANTIQILPLDLQIIENAAGLGGGGGNVEELVAPPYVGQTLKTMGYQIVPFTLTGTTAATTMMYPIGGFTAGEFQAENSQVRLRATGTANLVAGSATLTFVAGGPTIASVTLPVGAVFWEFELTYIVTVTGDTQRYFSRLTHSTGSTAPAVVLISSGTRTTAHSTTNLNFLLRGQLVNATDYVIANIAEAWTTNA